MKKLLAVLLALVLALSCTLAMAETTEAAETADAQPFTGLTIESEYDVDRDTLKDALTKMGTNEAVITIIDTIAAIVDQTGEKVVIANEGFQAEVLMKGNSLLNLVGLANGKSMTFGSNLIPNYTLDISFEELGDMIAGALKQAVKKAEKKAEEDPTQYLDMASLSQVVTEYFNDYILTISTEAIIPGTPEQGEFEQDGTTYNTRFPMDISLPVILDATKEFIFNLQNDETVQTALLTLALSGVNVNIEDTSELDEIDPAILPVVKAETYMTLDDNGNAVDWASNYTEIQEIYPKNGQITFTDLFLDKAIMTESDVKEVKYIVRMYSTPGLQPNGQPKSIKSTDGHDFFVSQKEVTAKFTTKGVITGIDELVKDYEVANVTYYNLLGVASDKPHAGVNIVTTLYTNGKITTEKRIFPAR